MQVWAKVRAASPSLRPINADENGKAGNLEVGRDEEEEEEVPDEEEEESVEEEEERYAPEREEED